MSSSRRLLVTSALPYANGHIHLGHLVEYLQTDIWVRFQKLRGHNAIYLCADDTHGTPIMMRARSEGRSEEELIREMGEAHQRDFADFGIHFDHYSSTNSKENEVLCGQVWRSLREKNFVVEREIEQLYDPEAGLFLADRFVKGQCPKPDCGALDQYGDNCEVCGSTYSPTDLINPKSAMSGATPELRKALHLFVELEKLHDFLNDWTQTGDHLQPGVAAYLKGHFLSEPLREWDISRPAPYFGFEIPDAPGNYWYVWFDAPIGYMATTEQWCQKNGQGLDDWWRSSDTEIHHFIGKDITYFHTLFWPAMLKAADFELPKKVHVHGFLTVNGEKMSKSKGTFIMARSYLDELDPAYLRYYYASKLTAKVDDLDLDIEDFVNKVNSDLVGKVVNLASRSARFVQESGLSAQYPEDGGLFEAAKKEGDAIAAAYEECDYARAMRLIMALADRANEYVDQKQPWALKKQAGKEAELQEVCTVALNLYRQLIVYLAPVLPRLAEQSGELLQAPIRAWGDANRPLVGTKLNPFSHLMQRADLKKFQKVIAKTREANPEAADATDKKSKKSASGTGKKSSEIKKDPSGGDYGQSLMKEPLAPECTIDDFGKVDLRVAKIVQAEEVPEAKKLLKLTVSLGGDIERTIFAGIKSAYTPEQLSGRLVVVVANLKPRKMKFGVSEGMVIAAGPGGEDIFLLSVDSGAEPGQRVG